MNFYQSPTTIFSRENYIPNCQKYEVLVLCFHIVARIRE
jgi:hypothetical protein